MPLRRLLRFERTHWAENRLLLGVDEVGRGPLAGPVVAGAVVFPLNHRGIKGVRDSKQVKHAEEREELAERIRAESLAWGLGAASVREIARHNIRRAAALAMRRAVLRCRARFPGGVIHVHILYVDGLQVPELGEPHESLVQGDGRCHAIAAASLLAKVARDKVMQALNARRPGFGWGTNVGYGTPEHLAALRANGLTPHHRLQFCDTALQGEMFGAE
jgi:ribonuclease HII